MLHSRSIPSIVTIAILALSNGTRISPADVLYRSFTPIGLGTGTAHKKSIDWSDCSRTEKTYLRPPYSIQKRGDDCKDTDLSFFGLRNSHPQGASTERTSYKVNDAAAFRSLFPDAEQGDDVFVSQTPASVIFQSKNRSIVLPRLGVADPSIEFANDLSIAVGFRSSKRNSATLQVIADASGILKTYSDQEIFKTQSDAEKASNLLSQLNASNGDVAGPAHYLFVDLAVARSHALKPPVPPAPTGTGAVFLSGRGNSFIDVHFLLGPNQYGFKLKPSDEDVLTGNLVRDSSISGGYQTLDGLSWDNVTFIGTKIIYNGGPVDLRNVRFYRCTFEVRTSREGNTLLKYASIDPAEVSASIGANGE